MWSLNNCMGPTILDSSILNIKKKLKKKKTILDKTLGKMSSLIIIRPCHMAAILSWKTKKAKCFTMPSLAVETMGVRLGVVKQSFFGLPRQYGRRVTRAKLICSHKVYSFGPSLPSPPLPSPPFPSHTNVHNLMQNTVQA